MTMQAPLPSGFGPSTTASEVLGDRRLDGIAIVTGGYAGIGLEVTRVLANAGATVIVPARSLDKARAALAGIPRVEIDFLDLADPASIDAFSSPFLASGRPVDILMNNAGIMAAPMTRDARGFESQLATNHLGHFQLTARLWPALARGARIISLSSRGHHRSGFDFDDPMFDRRPYDKWVAYGQSKTANVLFAVGLERRGAARGIHAFAVHPGGIVTELMRHLSAEEQAAFGVVGGKATAMEVESPITKTTLRLKTVEQGAATSIWAATSAALEGMGGVYCEDCDIAAVVQEAGANGVRSYAIDPDLAEELWKRSEAWTRVKLEG